MGLIDESKFQFTNAIPNQDAPWTDETANKVWKMFLDGATFARMSRELGKTTKAIRRQIENQLDHHYRHPNTIYVRTRDDGKWSKREVWVLNRARNNGTGAGVIAKLLGRTLPEVEGKLDQMVRRK